MKFKGIYFGLSAALVLVSVVALVLWQLKPSIDFAGGALLEVKFTGDASLDNNQISERVDSMENIDLYSVIYSRDTNSYQLRTNSIEESKKNEILANLGEVAEVEEVQFETVGPTLGQELLVKTLVAVVIAAILIMFYVTYQFKDRTYGVSAILAMLHDTLILVGTFSILGYVANVEVDTLFVTAILTTLSFSVHDTIVVFDRIRESLHQTPNAKFVDVVNKALTETLSRSLNNSMTIIFMLAALALLGGVTIKWFVVALLIGTILGTYSSPFVAAPILLTLVNRKTKK